MLPTLASQAVQADLPTPSSFYLQGASYKAKLIEGLLTWTIEQTFVNPHHQAVALQYVFPMHSEAIILDVSAQIGGREFTSAVVHKYQGRLAYVDAVNEGDTAILIERNSEGQFEMQIGNIMPGETLVVRYQTAQVLRIAQGSARIVMPTVIAMNYTVGEVKRAFSLTGSATAKYTMHAEVELEGGLIGAKISSPTHELTFHGGATLRVAVAGQNFMDRDFVLELDGLGELHPVGVLLRNPDAELANTDNSSNSGALLGNYLGLIDFMYGDSPVLPTYSQVSKPVELKLLLDCSGSMQGEPIGAAKVALQGLLSHLRNTDRVSFTCFGTAVTHWHFATAAVNSNSIRELRRRISQADATMGGTALTNALEELNKITTNGQADVLMITDGEVDGLSHVMKAAKKSGSRIFILAIGQDAQESLLSTVALRTGGAVEFIDDLSGINDALIRLMNCIRGESTTEFSVEHEQVIPESITTDPALFQFRSAPIFFSANNPHHAASVTAKVVGVKGDRVQLASVPVRVIESPEVAITLARLMAARRIEELIHTDRLINDDACDPWLGCTVADLALKYQLITPYTSALLTLKRAEEEKSEEAPITVNVPQMVSSESMRSLRFSGAGGGVVFRNPRPNGQVAQFSDLVHHCMEPMAALPEFLRRPAEKIVDLDALRNLVLQHSFDVQAFLDALELEVFVQFSFQLLRDNGLPEEFIEWVLAENPTKDLTKDEPALVQLLIEALQSL